MQTPQSEYKCRTCFYSSFAANEHPCSTCENYSKYVNANVYTNDFTSIKTWQDEDAFTVTEAKNDAINSPKHYTTGKFEVIDVIEDWDLNFRLANTVKYVARHKHKGKPLEDLKKALWYLQREIDRYERVDA